MGDGGGRGIKGFLCGCRRQEYSLLTLIIPVKLLKLSDGEEKGFERPKETLLS